jgi:hypothetical protein
MSTATKAPATRNGATPKAELPQSPGTRFPEIFQALAAEFHPHEVKDRAGGGGKRLSYITARTAMNRLDAVLGPENWQDEFYEVCDVLFCRITITLPDGSTVAKCDAGGFKTMEERNKKGELVEDEENTDKTGPSDAFKRAAAKFGIARYLYKDGVPDYAPPPPPPDNRSGHGRTGSYASPEQVEAYALARDKRIDLHNGKWSDRWLAGTHGEPPKGLKDLLNPWQVDGHLLKWAVETGRLDAGIVPEEAKSRQKAPWVAVVFHRSPEDRRALGAELDRYAAEQAVNQAEAIYRKHPKLRPAEDVPDGEADDRETWPDEGEGPAEPGSDG